MDDSACDPTGNKGSSLEEARSAAQSLGRSDLGLGLAMTLGALLLYGSTACRNLFWFDSAEFVNCAWFLDIPHPPGYPLFNVLAHLATRIPVGSIPFRVNVLSSILGAAAIGAIYLAGRRRGYGRPLAIVLAAMFATSVTFWKTCTIAEVYSLEILLVTITLDFYLRTRRSGSGYLSLGLACGLVVFHRLTNVFVVVGILVGILVGIRSSINATAARRLAFGLVLGATPYLQTAYVFFLGVPPGPGQPWSFQWFDHPRTLDTFLRIVTSTVYTGNLQILPLTEMAREGSLWATWALDQLGFILVALGILQAFRPMTRVGSVVGGRLLAWALASNLLFYLNYNALDRSAMYLPGLLALLFLAGDRLSMWTPPARNATLIIIAGVHVMGLAGITRPKPQMSLASYRGVENAVDQADAILPRGACLLLTDHLVLHPFLYQRFIEGERKDLTLSVVDRFDEDMVETIRERLRRGQAVYSPLFLRLEEFENVRDQFSVYPEGYLYRIQMDSEPLSPVHSPDRSLKSGVRLVGMSWIGERRDRIRATWRGLGENDQDRPFLAVGRVDPRILSVGHQGRLIDGDGFLTEEYVLPLSTLRDLTVQQGVNPEVRIHPSLQASMASGAIARVRTSDWIDHLGLHARYASFVKCMENNVPAHSWIFQCSTHDKRLAGGDLIPVDMIRP